MEKFIGCSGYYYNHWKGLFYPATLPKSKWLSFYAEHFNSVEINNTFYRMPEEKAMKRWYDITPGNFVFSVKGYRYFTHMKKLRVDDDLRGNLAVFERAIATLNEKIGCVLWQLPGSFKVNIETLEKFSGVLSHDFRHVFEFRNESWFNQAVYDTLERFNHGLCIVSAPGKLPEVVKTTSDTAYMRFHGKDAWYSSNYSTDDLQSWKNNLEHLGAERLLVYFNNDINAYAIDNARYLASLF